MNAGSSKRIAILGCGWLGLPLAEKLIAAGYRVRGSTTSSTKLNLLKERGVDPFLLEIAADKILGEFSTFCRGVEVLIINFPPGIRKQGSEKYIASIELLVREIEKSTVKKVLFVSSISVYEDTEEFSIYSEDQQANATSERGKGVMAAEEMIRSADFESCIIRLGGLIGGNRHPIRQLAGRKEVQDPEAPVNLIHLEDCVEVILKVLLKGNWGETFNAVYPEHPAKRTYYHLKAVEWNLTPPDFSQSPSRGKIVSSGKLQKELGHNFTHRI